MITNNADQQKYSDIVREECLKKALKSDNPVKALCEDFGMDEEKANEMLEFFFQTKGNFMAISEPRELKNTIPLDNYCGFYSKGLIKGFRFEDDILPFQLRLVDGSVISLTKSEIIKVFPSLKTTPFGKRRMIVLDLFYYLFS